MALAVTLLTARIEGWDTASDLSVTTASITPGANCFLVALIAGINDANGVELLFSTDSTLTPGHTLVSSGSGPTWTQRAATGSSPDNFYAQACVWTASIGGTDPGSFTVTADWKSTYVTGSSIVAIIRLTGHDTSTSFAGAIAQFSASLGTTGNGPASLTLPATPASGDVVLALSLADGGTPSASGGGAAFDNTARTWTELSDGVGSGHEIIYNVGWSTGSTSTTVAWSDVSVDSSDNYSSSQAAIIVKAGAGSGFTGTIVVTGPVATTTLVGTVTVPARTGTISATGPVAIAALAGVFIPTSTARTGTLVATGSPANSVLVGTFAPSRTGTLVVTAPGSISVLVGTFAAALVINTDDFNRANTATPGGLGSNWTDQNNVSGTARYYISSNRATMLNLDNWALWKTPMSGADHYVEADLDLAGNTGYVVINCRRPSLLSVDGYQAFLHPDNGQIEIGKAVGGAYTMLARGGVHSGSGKLRLQAVGSTLTAYLNGTQAVQATDTQLSTGLYVGLNGFSGNNGQNFWDNFAAAVTSAPPPGRTGTIVATGPSAVAALVGTFVLPTTNRVGTLVTTGPAAIAALVGTFTAPAVSFRYPAAIAGRKIVDQYGAVYLMRVMSSWAMASNLSNAEITQALTGIGGRGFNAVNVAIGGGADLGAAGWHRYTNKAGQNFWTGSPWQLATPSSPLGPAWSSVDWLLSESARLGITVNMSLFVSWGTTGAGPDLAAATNAHLYNVGCAVATRYLSYSNIVWHVEFDDASTSGSTVGQRVDSYFHGINDTEGAARRPVRWAEPNNGASIVGQLGGFVYVNLSMNGFYSYNSNSTELAEISWNEAGATAIPTGDVEPPYDGKSGWSGGALRYRSWAIFLEGGSYENYGHEDWWPFGASNPFGTEGITWQQVPNDTHTIQQGWIWSFADAYIADSAWLPDAAWVTTGQGSGDTKAAIGRSNVAMAAYFPDTRTVVVDTTQMPGTANVRLRWYDPVFGSYSSIAASEAQTASRSITYPGGHGDGSTDWVLIVDVVDRTGILVTTGPPAISGLRGTITAPVIYTGTLVTTGPVATAVLVGTFTPATPSRTGTLVATGPAATTALIGTVTAPAFTGVITATGPVATAALVGNFVPIASVRNGVLVALGPAPSATLVGTFTVPFVFAVLVALGPRAISNLHGTVVNPIPLAGEWFAGATPVAAVRLGTATVSAVYHGSNPVWGSGI